MKAIAVASFLLIAVTGCATSPIAPKDAQNVPAERIFRTAQLTDTNAARAVFIRNVGLAGSGVYMHLFVDGAKAASLNPGEKVEFSLPPGEHIFGVIPTDNFGTHALNTIDQDLKAGKRYYYRLQTDGNSFRAVVQRFIPETE